MAQCWVPVLRITGNLAAMGARELVPRRFKRPGSTEKKDVTACPSRMSVSPTVAGDPPIEGDMPVND